VTFLDGQPDLSRTVFAPDDLLTARQVLTSLIQALDPGWLKKPVGPLALHWKADGQYPATFLIHVAQVIYVLERNVTQRSVQVLRQKLRDLLRPPRQQYAFEELLSELEAVAFLAQRMSPISLEPLVPEEALNAANKPRSPDCGVRLPEGDVCFEVTNIHIGFLEDWDAAADGVADLAQRKLLRSGVRRKVELVTPVTASRVDMLESMEVVLPRILESESGEAKVPLATRGEAIVVWKSFPHLQTDASGMPVFPEGFSFGEDAVATSGGEPSPAVAVLHRPLIEGESLEEAAFGSIRNSLKAKRKQMVAEMPYVLVARLGHHRVNREAVSQLLHTRVFPNPDHAWISGVAMFVPRRNWEATEPEESMLLHVNPRAKLPLPESLLRVFDGEAEFHL
jgi:hypothetical protein